MAVAWRVNPARACACGQALAPGFTRVVRCACGQRVLRGQWLTCGGCGAAIAPGDEYLELELDSATLRRCAACGTRLLAERADYEARVEAAVAAVVVH